MARWYSAQKFINYPHECVEACLLIMRTDCPWDFNATCRYWLDLIDRLDITATILFMFVILEVPRDLSIFPLQWRHNERDGVSNHQPHDCLLNRLFGDRSKKNHNSALLAFVRGIHRSPVNSPHKEPVTPKRFPFDDVIMPFASLNDVIHWTTEMWRGGGVGQEH